MIKKQSGNYFIDSNDDVIFTSALLRHIWRSKYRAIAIQEGVLSELADIMLLINLIKKEKCNSTNPINQK